MKYRDDDMYGFWFGRPPRGGRGLKFVAVVPDYLSHAVAPLAGGVD